MYNSAGGHGQSCSVSAVTVCSSRHRRFAGMYGTEDEMPICRHPPAQTMDDVTTFFLCTYIHIIGNSVGAKYPFAVTCGSALRNLAGNVSFPCHVP